ncbi:hypothetical protein [Kitasatospora acidiphila]|uniref:hypothetical protein n=1 Tax=Kitasatospora acidiphila TaxID=2567942 RepID=UPI003C767345
MTSIRVPELLTRNTCSVIWLASGAGVGYGSPTPQTTNTRYTTCVTQYLIPDLGKKKLAKLTAKDVRTWLNRLRTVCQCCARGIDARRKPDAPAGRAAAPSASAAAGTSPR